MNVLKWIIAIASIIYGIFIEGVQNNNWELAFIIIGSALASVGIVIPLIQKQVNKNKLTK